jgi:hypothetical protein
MVSNRFDGAFPSVNTVSNRFDGAFPSGNTVSNRFDVAFPSGNTEKTNVYSTELKEAANSLKNNDRYAFYLGMYF